MDIIHCILNERGQFANHIYTPDTSNFECNEWAPNKGEKSDKTNITKYLIKQLRAHQSWHLFLK